MVAKARAGAGGAKTPDPKVGDIVVLRWRDHWSNNDDHDETDWLDDCIIRSVGEVVRVTDKFLTLSGSVTETLGHEKFGNAFHVWRVLIQDVQVVGSTLGTG